jgi:hypothetical protein
LQPEHEPRDPFAEIVGRALIEPGYRDTLLGGSEDEKTALLVAAGLSEAQAADLLPLLEKAKDALLEFSNHEAFPDVRISAA